MALFAQPEVRVLSSMLNYPTWILRRWQWFSPEVMFTMDKETKQLTALHRARGSMSVIECPLGWPIPLPLFSGWWKCCLWDLNLNWCIIYLDDIVIFLKDLASHLKRLEAVFQKLEQARLKLKPSKCELFPQADHIFGAHCLCPGNSDQWRQNRCY